MEENYTKSDVERLIAIDLIKQHGRVLKDSIKLLGETSNARTFFGRYDDTLRVLAEIKGLIKSARIKKIGPEIDMMMELLEDENCRTQLIVAFIDRAIYADKGELLAQELWKYADKLTPESLKYAEYVLGNVTVPNQTAKGEYLYCFVEFEPGGKQYCYLSDDLSIKEGTEVIVPVGNYGEETDAVVAKAEFYKEDCPYPPKKMKRIIAKYDYV